MAYINIHTHQVSKDDGIICIENVFPEEYSAGNYSSGYVSVGIHPWYIQYDGVEQLKLLRATLSDKRVVCIGEAGLDKRKGADFLLQESVFLQQLKLSEEFKKPLVIHCVKAYNELIALRKKMKPSSPWIFHGFSGSIQIMEQALQAGFYFSFGAALLKEKSKARQVMIEVPLERCFLETDDANISISELYYLAAGVKGLKVSEIEGLMEFNFNALFK